MDVDLNDYVAGGYFVVKYSDRGFSKSDLMPERVISISNCIGKKFKIYWGWDVLQNRQDILDFGIPEAKLSAFEAWAKDEVSITFPGVFYSLQAAREFSTAFLTSAQDVVLVGIGLPNNMVDGYLAGNPQTGYDPVKQTYHADLYGVNYVLHQKGRLTGVGKAIGFEIVGENFGLSCSWLCSNIEKDVNELFDIHPNQYGLIDSYEDAIKVHNWIAEDETGDVRGEPEPYYLWLIVQYPL